MDCVSLSKAPEDCRLTAGLDFLRKSKKMATTDMTFFAKAEFCTRFSRMGGKSLLVPSVGSFVWWNMMILIFFIIFGARSLTRVILAFGEHNHESGNWLQK